MLDTVLYIDYIALAIDPFSAWIAIDPFITRARPRPMCRGRGAVGDRRGTWDFGEPQRVLGGDRPRGDASEDPAHGEGMGLAHGMSKAYDMGLARVLALSKQQAITIGTRS